METTTTKQTHTPGPWEVNVTTDMPYGPNKKILPRYKLTRPAQRNDPWFSEAESKANAHLIAAAPELLEALEHMDALFNDEGCFCCEYTDQLSVALEKSYAAIRKAKGEL